MKILLKFSIKDNEISIHGVKNYVLLCLLNMIETSNEAFEKCFSLLISNYTIYSILRVLMFTSEFKTKTICLRFLIIYLLLNKI